MWPNYSPYSCKGLGATDPVWFSARTSTRKSKVHPPPGKLGKEDRTQNKKEKKKKKKNTKTKTKSEKRKRKMKFKTLS